MHVECNCQWCQKIYLHCFFLKGKYGSQEMQHSNVPHTNTNVQPVARIWHHPKHNRSTSYRDVCQCHSAICNVSTDTDTFIQSQLTSNSGSQ